MSKPSFKELISSETPTLVDFYATWCGPCQTLAPILKEVASALEEKVKIVKIDIDKNPAVATQLEVRSVPTLILFKKGNILWRQSGVMPAQALQSQILQHI